MSELERPHQCMMLNTLMSKRHNNVKLKPGKTKIRYIVQDNETATH